MAKRGDPGVLKHVVVFLRSRADMTQAQFGRAARIDQADVCRYELGRTAPSEEALRRMADVAGIDWSLVVHLRQFLTFLLSAAERQSQILDGQPLDLAALEPARLAAVPYLLETGTMEPARRTPEQERREAAEIWARLGRFSISWRRRLIELSPRLGSWALAERANEESILKAAHDPGEALELAEMALSIAERVPGPESWRSRVMGYCWAHVANARRVSNDHAGADEAFVRAWDLWRAGADAEGLLPEWRLFDLEASLRRAERRFPEALELLDRARSGCGGDPLAAGRILLNKEHAFNQMGDVEAALATLMEAAPLVEASGDRRLLFALRFNMTDDLCNLERFEEAAALSPQVREMAAQQGNELDLLRVRWLEGRVEAGQGRRSQAAEAFAQVRTEFASRGMGFDAALATLDLAALYLKEGRTVEVKDLAREMVSLFHAQGVHREALAALRLFRDAAEREAVTLEMARRLVQYLERARQDPDLRFAGG